jgi:hypothetical protein
MVSLSLENGLSISNNHTPGERVEINPQAGQGVKNKKMGKSCSINPCQFLICGDEIFLFATSAFDVLLLRLLTHFWQEKTPRAECSLPGLIRIQL